MDTNIRPQAGEKKREETLQILKSEPKLVANEENAEICAELSKAYSAGQLDAFGIYLYGICLRATEDPTVTYNKSKTLQEWRKESVNARKLFIESINRFPWNWSAWLDLSSTIQHDQVLTEVITQLPNHEFKSFFVAHTYVLLGNYPRALLFFRTLNEKFGDLHWVRAGYASTLSKVENITKSPNSGEISKKFEEIRSRDPHNFSWLEYYARFLMATEQKETLCELAMDATSNSKWTVENYLTVAYFHAMHGARELVLSMLENVTKIDPGCSSGWEVVASLNLGETPVPLAIQNMQNALSISPYSSDIRTSMGIRYAWDMPTYAYYHLQKAYEQNALKASDFRDLAYFLSCLGPAESKKLSKTILEALEATDSLQEQETEILNQLWCSLARRAGLLILPTDKQNTSVSGEDPVSATPSRSSRTPHVMTSGGTRFSGLSPRYDGGNSRLNQSVLPDSDYEEEMVMEDGDSETDWMGAVHHAPSYLHGNPSEEVSMEEDDDI